ncbi:hypothetical protein ACP4OV_021170 [Aristida adscensionis]
MEVLLSAVASDLMGRLVSFLISKFQEPSGTMDDVVRLQQVLLRAVAVVEEAEGRHITNRAMLLQLSQLRAQMFRGSYVLDTFMRRAVDPNRRSLAVAGRSRLPPGIDGATGLAAAESLEAALSDMREFVVLLGSFPRLNRQPYSAYLFMESCMFGRQLEKEQIVGFLLQPARDLDVLPIIGPHDVGKRTLVEHVCLDERVKQYFPEIRHLNGDDLDHIPSPDNEHHQSLVDATARPLIVIHLRGGVDTDEEEETWRRFHSSMRRLAHIESKIILISRSERHSSLGTVPALRLRAPRREELWYLFKALAFGGADPGERPELVHVAVALFASIPAGVAPFAVASKLAASLRADLSARSWRRVQKVSAGATELELGGAIPGWRDRPEKTGFYYPSMPVKDAPRAPFLFYSRRKLTGVARSELPKVTMQELLDGAGAVLPGGDTRFDVLVWQSRIPPYGSYVATCDMETAQQVVTGKKRLDKRRGQRQDEPCN